MSLQLIKIKAVGKRLILPGRGARQTNLCGGSHDPSIAGSYVSFA
jgi:hypothetical protein